MINYINGEDRGRETNDNKCSESITAGREQENNESTVT